MSLSSSRASFYGCPTFSFTEHEQDFHGTADNRNGLRRKDDEGIDQGQAGPGGNPDGPIGIYAQMVARFSGAEAVIGVDVSGDRLAMARKMGADIALNPREVNVQDEVDRITHGAGMDIVVELTGNRGVVNEASQTLRRGGEMVLVGLYPGPVEIDLVNNVIYKEATVYGVTGRIMWDTWWTAQSMLLTGRMDISPVITHRFDLADYDQAFVLAESAASGKILFTI